MSKISKNIKKQRVLNKMTQEDLAAKIHVTRQTVSSWETDRTQPDLEILLSLADAFGIEVEELIYGKRKNSNEEKEKLLFGNTLITVLSVLGCLLIGAGVVMIFVKFWQDFPDLLKIFTCFVPALLGQGIGIYTYIKKKESIPWCEGASVFWMLGTGVTSVILLSQTDSRYVEDGVVFFFFAICFFALMFIFKSLAAFAVSCFCSIAGYIYMLDSTSLFYTDYYSEVSTGDIIKSVLCIVAEALFVAAAVYASSRLYKKESNVIRYTFSQWINFAVAVAFVVISAVYLGSENIMVQIAVLYLLVCFVVGHKHDSLASPYKFFGTFGTAAMLAFFAMVPESAELDSIKGGIILTAICLLAFVLVFAPKTRVKNIYLRAYSALFALALFIYNVACILTQLRQLNSDNTALFDTLKVIREGVYTLNFIVGIAAFVMLVVYGARERKLLQLNLGFVLSCALVIVRLYLLDLGLIMTGVMLIVCGVGLLFVNLKISRLRERDAAGALSESEVEEQ